MMRTRAAAAAAEAVTSIAALRSGTLRRRGAILRTLYCLPLAVHVGAIIRTFRLSLLWLGGRRLRSLGGQRSEEYCRERYDANESSQEKHGCVSFRLSVSNSRKGGERRGR